MIYIAIIVLINFLIWLFCAILWNNILSEGYKREIAYKNAGIDISEEPKITGDSTEERVQSFFQDKQFQESFKNDFLIVHTHDQNIRLAIAVWGLISIFLGVLMIWILDLFPYLFSLINV
tara:strand:+ start:575 stop:934 length:360 start_codon:yes stop_codon:yes gene_type:complete